MQKRLDPVEIEADAWCSWCGDPLPEVEERVYNRKFCCDACRRAHWHDINGPAYIPKRAVTCAGCGSVFHTHRSNARFCCVSCWRTRSRRRDVRPSRAKPPPPPRACIECGQTFQPRRKDRLYCSTSCGNRHRNKRWRLKGYP